MLTIIFHFFYLFSVKKIWFNETARLECANIFLVFFSFVFVMQRDWKWIVKSIIICHYVCLFIRKTVLMADCLLPVPTIEVVDSWQISNYLLLLLFVESNWHHQCLCGWLGYFRWSERERIRNRDQSQRGQKQKCIESLTMNVDVTARNKYAHK